MAGQENYLIWNLVAVRISKFQGLTRALWTNVVKGICKLANHLRSKRW